MNNIAKPLAERMRPTSLDCFFGQEHLTKKNAPLRIAFDNQNFHSMIFWGPPGVGKTTLAHLISKSGTYNFIRISAVEAGVRDLRKIISEAENLLENKIKTLLFIDEIHRFNKSQQDSLLHSVESGIITLIGATTENPSFEVNSALLSRCRVYKLNELDLNAIKNIIDYSITNDELLSKYKIIIDDYNLIYKLCGGDARGALNTIEAAFNFSDKSRNEIKISQELLEKAVLQRIPMYDKQGESHYDTISAFIKSMRGSDPDAAIFWLAKMIESGEDPKFIARRMVIFASEDIGNADTNALNVAVNVFNAVNLIGLPECRINLAQGVIYLSSAPKSNASYLAIDSALSDIRAGVDTSVPLHLRNAPTKLMKTEGYGKDYKYPHDYENHFVVENYFPVSFSKQYYFPTDEGIESKIKQRLSKLWSNKKKSD
ncbi:replication-associated recombination protein A [Candidatus Kapaibacterium sp.]